MVDLPASKLAGAGLGGGPVGSEGSAEACQDCRVLSDPTDLAPQVEAVAGEVLAPEKELLAVGDHQLGMQVSLTKGLAARADHRVRLLQAAGGVIEKDLDRHPSRSGVVDSRNHSPAH